MICKGQKAKVTYCKEANYSQPVSAETKPPKKGTIQDGMKKVRVVGFAETVAPSWRESKLRQDIEVLSVQKVAPKYVAKGQAVTCAVLEPKLQNKELGNAKEDITIDKLFSKCKL